MINVSFIVPVYNVESYIKQCIEQLLLQDLGETEVILVDDGSTDRSGIICDEYAQRYDNIHVIHQKNKGVSVARNEGIKKSNGKWLFFVDADDIVSHSLYAECKNYLTDQNDVCLVGHSDFYDTIRIEPHGTEIVILDDFMEIREAILNRDIKGQFDYHKLKLATPWPKFYKAEIIRNKKIFFPEGVSVGEDAIFNFIFFTYAKLGIYITKELYFHRIWAGAVSQKYNPRITVEFDKFHDVLIKTINNLPIYNKSKIKKRYNERCIWSVGFCCMLKFCNDNNPENYIIRRRDFIKYRNSYLKEIRAVDLKDFRWNKKILFWLIKKKWFMAINILVFLQSKWNVIISYKNSRLLDKRVVKESERIL